MANFEKFENSGLIHKIAWSFHCTTGLDYDDLFSEASYLYCKALQEYDPARGSIVSYFSYYVHCRLINYLKQQQGFKCKKYNDDLSFIDDLEIENQPSKETTPFWESLNEDAQEITDIILSTPRAWIHLTHKEVEDRVIAILSRKGWSLEKITAGLENIHLSLSI
jgi:DNA-directed RNA polymerase specialized sigma subunit